MGRFISDVGLTIGRQRPCRKLVYGKTKQQRVSTNCPKSKPLATSLARSRPRGAPRYLRSREVDCVIGSSKTFNRRTSHVWRKRAQRTFRPVGEPNVDRSLEGLIGSEFGFSALIFTIKDLFDRKDSCLNSEPPGWAERYVAERGSETS